jgi:hypothetical protein
VADPSGLPRTLHSDPEFTRQRRHAWWLLVGLGFVVMAVLALVLAVASGPTAGAFVVWLYWFVWTWVAWLVADRRTVRSWRRMTGELSATGPV